MSTRAVGATVDYGIEYMTVVLYRVLNVRAGCSAVEARQESVSPGDGGQAEDFRVSEECGNVLATTLS